MSEEVAECKANASEEDTCLRSFTIGLPSSEPGILVWPCRNGSLDLSEASRFLRSLLPELGARQLQYVLSYLAALDLDGDGTLTFSELMTGLHALQVRAGTIATAAHKQQSSAPERRVHVDRVFIDTGSQALQIWFR